MENVWFHPSALSAGFFCFSFNCHLVQSLFSFFVLFSLLYILLISDR